MNKPFDWQRSDPELMDMSTNLLPTVTCDIKLGQTYSSVDFDYVAFNRLADELGIPEEAVPTVNIHVMSGLPLVGGGYVPDEGIYISPRNANGNLAHELQHNADKINGHFPDLASWHMLRYNIGKVSLLALFAAAVVEVGSVFKPDLAEPALKTTVVAAAGSLLYYFDPLEVRARRAQHRHVQDVLSFTHRLHD